MRSETRTPTHLYSFTSDGGAKCVSGMCEAGDHFSFTSRVPVDRCTSRLLLSFSPDRESSREPGIRGDGTTPLLPLTSGAAKLLLKCSSKRIRRHARRADQWRDEARRVRVTDDRHVDSGKGLASQSAAALVRRVPSRTSIFLLLLAISLPSLVSCFSQDTREV